MFKTIFRAALVVAFLATFAAAQDTLKVYAGFINGNFDLGITNNQGVNGSAQLKLYGYEGVKLEAVGDFSDYLRNKEKVYVYLAGPQVSVDLFEHHLTPFARIMFGTTRYDGKSSYAHSIGGGLDVNIGDHFFFRPFQYDKQTTDKYTQPVHRLGVGLGLRFGGTKQVTYSPGSSSLSSQPARPGVRKPGKYDE